MTKNYLQNDLKQLFPCNYSSGRIIYETVNMIIKMCMLEKDVKM